MTEALGAIIVFLILAFLHVFVFITNRLNDAVADRDRLQERFDSLKAQIAALHRGDDE